MQEAESHTQLLAENLKQKGIKAVLFDLDDTILDTNNLFSFWIHAFVSGVVEKNPNLDWREVMDKFTEINNEAFKTLSVDTKKLAFVAQKMDSFFGTHPMFSRHGDVVGQIYKNSPKILPGARETLEAFKETGIPMALVTHANVKWTNRKVEDRDLKRYFTHIEVVNEKRFKGSEDWLNAINILGVKPQEVLVIGDNLQGDINSARSIGVKNLVWIESIWSVYRQGIVPEGITKVKKIGDVIGALIAKPLCFSFQNQGQVV